MTHDELLARLSSTNRRYGGTQDNSALRAVVELHKPNEFYDCGICIIRTVLGPTVQPYPCPTIEAIEKELN